MKALAFALMALIVSANAQAACKRDQCDLWIRISTNEQLMYVYYKDANGTNLQAFQVSSGAPGTPTPQFEGHPIRIEEYWDSSIYPEGDYQDPQTGKSLGNMPYAMFFKGGYAIHGTPVGNFRRIGTAVSHGCVRMYSDQAKWLNRLMRKFTVNNTYISITHGPIGSAEGQASVIVEDTAEQTAGSVIPSGAGLF